MRLHRHFFFVLRQYVFYILSGEVGVLSRVTKDSYWICCVWIIWCVTKVSNCFYFSHRKCVCFCVCVKRRIFSALPINHDSCLNRLTMHIHIPEATAFRSVISLDLGIWKREFLFFLAFGIVIFCRARLDRKWLARSWKNRRTIGWTFVTPIIFQCQAFSNSSFLQNNNILFCEFGHHTSHQFVIMI